MIKSHVVEIARRGLRSAAVLSDFRRASRAALTLVAITAAAAVILALANVPLSRTADVVTVIVAPLGVIGLLLGAWQLARTATATQAATREVNRAARDFVTYRVMSLISDAHRVALALDAASSGPRPDQTRMREALLDWNRVGGELRGLLDGHNKVEQQLLDDMTETFALATTAKERLIPAGGSPTAATATEAARVKIAAVTVSLGVLSGTLQAQIGREDT